MANEVIDIGLHFGPKMSDGLLERRYGPLYRALGSVGLRVGVFRGGSDYYDAEARTFADYSLLLPEGGVERLQSPARVDILRDYSGKYERPGTFALNDPGVWAITRDKAEIRETLGEFLPESRLLPAGATFEQRNGVREFFGAGRVAVKPTRGRASEGVSIVDIQNTRAWEYAFGIIDCEKDVVVERYVDTTKPNRLMPDVKGRPSTVRIIAADGDPHVVVARIGKVGARMVSGGEDEEYRFLDPELLNQAQRRIVTTAHVVAAERGNGHSYLGVDLLCSGDVSYLGEINSRPAVIEVKDDSFWSQHQAERSAAYLAGIHRGRAGAER